MENLIDLTSYDVGKCTLPCNVPVLIRSLHYIECYSDICYHKPQYLQNAKM